MQFLYRIMLKRRIKRPPRRIRLMAAFLFALIIFIFSLSHMPSVSPRYYFTIGDKFTFLTPSGFTLGQLYDFSSIDASSELKEFILPLPDSRRIIFKYPQVVAFGNPLNLGGEILQSVDFTVKDPPSHGLVQIWNLNTSLDKFLELSKDSSSIDYLSFDSKKNEKDHIPYTVWEYTFNGQGKIIRAMEAFFDDNPYMFRISIYAEDSAFNEDLRKIFEDMLNSVTVK